MLLVTRRLTAFYPSAAPVIAALPRSRVLHFAAASRMSSDGKRRKLEGGSAGSPVASLVLQDFDSEVLASHKQSDSFKVPGGLHCTDHSFRTALDYSGEVGVCDPMVIQSAASHAPHMT